jgi:hypothetical protein
MNLVYPLRYFFGGKSRCPELGSVCREIAVSHWISKFVGAQFFLKLIGLFFVWVLARCVTNELAFIVIGRCVFAIRVYHVATRGNMNMHKLHKHILFFLHNLL